MNALGAQQKCLLLFFCLFFFFKSSLMDKPDCRNSSCHFHVGNDTVTTKTDGEKFVAQGPSLHRVDIFRGKKHGGIFLCKILEQERLKKACLLESTNHLSVKRLYDCCRCYY